jgi:DNA-binding SARP family transcriptional activator
VIVDGTLEVLPVRQTRAALAALVVHHPTPLSADALAELLWPDGRPERWEASLYAHVSRLRRLIGADRLPRTPAGYRLEIGTQLIDLRAAETEITEGRAALAAGDTMRGVRHLRRALARWRGPAFREIEEFGFADDAARSTVALRVGALEALGRALLEAGRPDDAANVAATLVREDRWSVAAWALRITALLAADRLDEARRVQTEAHLVFTAELGLEPGPELRLVDDPSSGAGGAPGAEHAAGPGPDRPSTSSGEPVSGPSSQVDADGELVLSLLAVAGVPLDPDLLTVAAGLGAPRLFDVLRAVRADAWLAAEGRLQLVDDERARRLRAGLGEAETALLLRRLAEASAVGSATPEHVRARWALGAVAAGFPLEDALAAGSRGIVDAVRRGEHGLAAAIADLVDQAVARGR